MKRMGIVLVGVVLVVGCIFLLSKKDTKEILITEEQELDNTSLVFMLQDEEGNYDKSDTLPSTGYTLNASKSVCSDNATPTWEDNKLYINNLTKKGTSCYLYFDKKPMAMNTILADNPIIDDSRNNGITGPLTENTTGTLYTAEDDWGTSYVFAGDVDNNWVQFAGFYWRIIRINGDSSIRMIYSGDSSSGPVETGEATQIGTSAFNEQMYDNAYVGYMYGTPGSDTYEETHANINDSTIKTVLDTWYQNNLISYSVYISIEAGFCNDRSVNLTDEVWWDGDTKLGYGTNKTAYGPFGRLYAIDTWKAIQTPSLRCSQKSDLFTVRESGQGNQALDYPIGLITADEVVYAGGFGGSNNTDYYLYTNLNYRTMSPYCHPDSAVFIVNANGFIGNGGVRNSNSIRPVINLDANVTLSGSGTSTDPYVVEGAM